MGVSQRWVGADLAWRNKVSIIVAFTFCNKDCISTYSGVKVNWRHQLDTDLRSAWTFGKASHMTRDFGSMEVWIR